MISFKLAFLPFSNLQITIVDVLGSSISVYVENFIKTRKYTVYSGKRRGIGRFSAGIVCNPKEIYLREQTNR